jgi:hypothetical protein
VIWFAARDAASRPYCHGSSCTDGISNGNRGGWLFCFDLCLAGASAVEEVLKVCREKRERFNPLHVQAVHTEEPTEAFAKSEEKQAANISHSRGREPTDHGLARCKPRSGDMFAVAAARL